MHDNAVGIDVVHVVNQKATHVGRSHGSLMAAAPKFVLKKLTNTILTAIILRYA